MLKGQFLTYFKSPFHSKPQKDKCINLYNKNIRSINDHEKGNFAFEIFSTSSCKSLNETYTNKVKTNPSQNRKWRSPAKKKNKSENEILRFVLFASTEEEQNKWITAFGIATRGTVV